MDSTLGFLIGLLAVFASGYAVGSAPEKRNQVHFLQAVVLGAAGIFMTILFSGG